MQNFFMVSTHDHSGLAVPINAKRGGAANMIGEECLVGNEDVGPLLPAQHVTLHKIIIGQTVR